MSRFQEIQARVSRFLRGEYVFEDLRVIFLWLRDRDRSARLVGEIGNFLSHANDRDRGIVHGIVGNFAQGIVVYVKAYRNRGNINREGFELLKKIARSNYDAMPNHLFRKEFGTKKADLREVFEKAMTATAGIEDGQALVTRPVSDIEAALLNRFFTKMRVNVAFNSKELIQDLTSSLVRNNLVERSQVNSALAKEDWVAIFAICTMHLTKIYFDEHTKVTLFAGLGYSEGNLGNLGVQCEVQVGDHPMRFVICAFSTWASPAQWCGNGIVLHDQYPSITAPIEVDRHGKLQIFH